MNHKERLTECLAGREPDRVPVLAKTRDFTMYHHGLGVGQCLKEPARYVEAELKTFEEYNLDGLTGDLYGGMPILNELFGQELFVTKGVDGMDQPAFAKPVLGTLGDFKKWPKKIDVQGHRCTELARFVTSELKKSLGPDVPLINWVPAPFRSACFFRGVSNLMLDLIDEPAELIEEFMEVCLDLTIDFCKVLIDAGVDCINISNPTASRALLSKKHYERFVHPYTKRLCKFVQDQSTPVQFHICGDWTDRLDLLAQENVAIFHVDKINLKEAKEKLSGSVIMGNVKTVDTLLHSTPDAVEKEALDCITQGAPGGRFILSGDCVIPPKTPKDNFKALTNSVLKYGRYPISN